MISDIETAILSLVEENLRYGYEIDKTIEKRNMRDWTEVAFSSIYYVLKKLEKRDFITSSVEEVSGKPSRKVYQITDAGGEALREKLVFILSNYEKVIDPFDLGINGLGRLTVEEIINALNNYIASVDEAIRLNRERRKNIEEAGYPFYIRGLATRSIAHLESEKAWIKGFLREIVVNDESKNFGMKKHDKK